MTFTGVRTVAGDKRRIAAIALIALTLGGACRITAAQDAGGYPVAGRTVRMIVPHGLGAGADILARLIGPKIAERWKVAVVPDNRTGANGDIGIGLAAAAEPDGYTMMCVATIFTISPVMKKNLPYDPVKSFQPVALLSTSVLSLLVGSGLPVTTFAEFVALARQRPGALNYGSTGTGSPQYVAMELLKLETKTDLFHVPYRDAASSFRDLLTGELQAVIQPLQTAAPYVQNGNVRMLAVMSAERAPAFPDVPTMRELGFPNFVVETWYGMFAPAGTPPAIMAKWNAEINAILQEPDIRTLLARQGMNPIGGTPERLASYVKDDLARWQRVVDEAGIRPE
jgi:tripartite-type tricarboxylate transporter receptor subunit TctC